MKNITSITANATTITTVTVIISFHRCESQQGG